MLADIQTELKVDLPQVLGQSAANRPVLGPTPLRAADRVCRRQRRAEAPAGQGGVSGTSQRMGRCLPPVPGTTCDGP
jgi:hypothetical protein